MKVPRHIAFIMDGNGRWARSRDLPVAKGHEQGLVALESVLDHCFNLGIKQLTCYAFSSENWKRSEEEKKVLFDLLTHYFGEKIDQILKKDVRIKIIGEIDHFSSSIQKMLRLSEERSRANQEFLLQMALSYGGKDEIVRATKRICHRVVAGEVKVDEINPSTFSHYLDTEGSDPDLLIRTGGEMRISNFLLYQMAYTEFYFTPTYWPDFKPEEVDRALAEFGRRERRFGGR